MEIKIGLFGTVVSRLNELGFYGFVLPWVLTFAIVYAILLKTKVLGDNAGIAAVVAFAVAFMVPLLTVFGESMGTVFVTLFGFGALIIAMIVMALLIFGMLGVKV